jgi:Cytochrome P460
MTTCKTAALAAALSVSAISCAIDQVRAGGEKVMLPEALGTLYTTVDRADNKQYRELYVSPAAAIDAAKKGEPLPSGTVLTLVQYAAQLDGQGNPVKDANGRFIKTNVVGYTVMEKRTGWGTEYPDDIRNGDWEYQAFTADKKVNDKAVLANCFKCHKPLDKQDFVFSYDKLKAPSAAR